MEIPTFTEISLLDTEAALAMEQDLVALRGVKRALLNEPGLSEEDAEELTIEVDCLTKLIRACWFQSNYRAKGPKGVRYELRKAKNDLKRAELEIENLRLQLKKLDSSRRSALLTVRMLREKYGEIQPVKPVKVFYGTSF